MASTVIDFKTQILLIQKDLELYSHAANISGRIDDRHIHNVVGKLTTLISKIGVWFNDVAIKQTSSDSFQLAKDMMCTKFSSEWAIWSRNETSLAFIEVNDTTKMFSTDNVVVFDFHPNSDSKNVIFYCKTRILPTQLKFSVRISNLVETVRALLKSFQSASVLANKMDDHVKPMMEKWVQKKRSISSVNSISPLVKEEVDSLPVESAVVDYHTVKIAEDDNPTESATTDMELSDIDSGPHESDVDNDSESEKNPRRAEIEDGADDVPPIRARLDRAKKAKPSSVDFTPRLSKPKPVEPQRCRLCHLVVGRFQVSSHLAKKHDIHENVCCFCPKSFDTHLRRYRHIAMYHPRRPAKNIYCQPCKECELFISRKESYDHMEIEHGKPDECPFCHFKVGKDDSSRLNLTEIVSQSNTNFSASKKLKSHISKMHKTRFDCNFCGEVFRSREAIREHRNRDLDESERTVEPCKNKETYKPPRHVCNLCGISTFGMKKHMSSAHPSEPGANANYECLYCKQKFCQPRDLKRHLARSHHLQTQFECNLCDKTFPILEALNGHQAFHAPPSLKCPRCDKYFKWKTNVIQHLRGCHYPPKYECLPCGQKFHHRSAVRLHLDKHHHIQSVDGLIKTHYVDMEADLAKIYKKN